MTSRIDAAAALRENRVMAEASSPETASASLGSEFAQALQGKDITRLRELLAPEIDFRALTPNRFWEASNPDSVFEIAFGHWFEDSDEIRALERVETDEVADRERVGYRLSIENPEGRFLVEQQAFLSATDDGRIGWMRIVCSGYRPVEG